MATATKPIVVIGGGFAGVYCAKRLQRVLPADWEIIHFSQENHLVFTPLLGNVVGSSINPMHVVWPIRQMVPQVNCRTAAVTGLDLERKEVLYQTATNQPARQPFEHLVLACGTMVNLGIVPGMAAHGWPLKSMGDALVLRNHLISLLEKAQVEPNPDARRRMLSVVVVGGGFSGVEVAGEIHDLLAASCRYYSAVPPSEVRVTLLHSRDRILPELSASLAEFAQRKMRDRGIDIRLKSAAQAVTECGVRLKDGTEVEGATVVCTIGSTVNPLLKALLPAGQTRLPTGADFRVQGQTHVWALGDCAAVPNAYDGQPSPPTAQFAVRQAKQLADNLARVVRGEATRPFHFKPLGVFASIGNRRAVGKVFGVPLSGLPAWFLWRGIYLSKMPTLARKVQIAFDWMWQLFFARDIVQLNLWQTERLSHAHYETGQFVFHKDDLGDKFYVIERGQAGVYVNEAAAPIAVLNAGDHFGEAALLGGVTRSASIRAEQPLDVLVIGRESFAQMTHHFTVLRAALLQSVARIQAANRGVGPCHKEEAPPPPAAASLTRSPD
jgi:NADH dehydrogenase